MFGTDPASELLSENQNLPWAVVPLRLTSRLWGYISADNKYTEAALSTESLAFMTLIGALTTQLLADSERQGQGLEYTSAGADALVSEATTPLLRVVHRTVNEREMPESYRSEWQDRAFTATERVRKILDEATKFPLSRRIRDIESIQSIVSEKAEALNCLSPRGDVKIDISLPSTDCLVVADRHGISRVLGWLLDIAIERERAAGRGSIQLQVYLQDMHAVVNVTDHGKMLDDRLQFFETSQELRASQAIVRAHGSTLRYISSLGATTLSFTLRRAEIGDHNPGRKILLVSAFAQLTRQLRYEIKATVAGCVIEECANYREAAGRLELVPTGYFDLLITDLSIPRLAGDLPRVENGIELITVYRGKAGCCLIVTDGLPNRIAQRVVEFSATTMSYEMNKIVTFVKTLFPHSV